MLAIDRQRMIVEQVRQNASVRVVDLAEEFGVTGETIRRDLEILEQRGLLERVHGGAVNRRQQVELRFQDRESHRVIEKRAIAELAASMVVDGETIIIDVGTTALVFCEYLSTKKDLTVITPSLKAALLLKQTTNARVLVTGGELQDDEPYLTGYITQSFFSQYHVHKAFIAAGGISLDVGLTDYNDEEVQVRKAMIQSANQVIVLADSSKAGVRAFSVIGPLSVMDVWVTDDAITAEMAQKIEQLGIDVLKADTTSL